MHPAARFYLILLYDHLILFENYRWIRQSTEKHEQRLRGHMPGTDRTNKGLFPLLVHPDTERAGDIFHCCVHRDLVHLAISASRCYAPVLTKHGAPRSCRRRTGSLVHFCRLLYKALCLFRVRDLLKKRRTRQWLNLEVGRCGAAVRLKIAKPIVLLYVDDATADAAAAATSFTNSNNVFTKTTTTMLRIKGGSAW